MENYFLLENYTTSEGAVPHNVGYYQPLPINRHKVRFYANNYFESTAFNKTRIEMSKKKYISTEQLSFELFEIKLFAVLIIIKRDLIDEFIQIKI